MSIRKTNAARILDRLGIPYELASFAVDLDDLSAVHAAEKLGVNPLQVFKTLLVRGEPGGLWLACLPAAAALDLKRLAAVTGNKRMALTPLKEVLPLTGYMRGGCSPIGTRKAYPVCIHSSARDFDAIYISAGQRGMQFFLAPDDLARAVDARFADICA